jgi:transcriptional regulator with XRE-family HTH domain
MESFELKKQFSKKLKEVRARLGLSILDLARRSGVSRQHIRDLELANKYVTLKTLCKLSNALGVPMWKLVYSPAKKCRWN